MRRNPALGRPTPFPDSIFSRITSEGGTIPACQSGRAGLPGQVQVVPEAAQGSLLEASIPQAFHSIEWRGRHLRLTVAVA